MCRLSCPRFQACARRGREGSTGPSRSPIPCRLRRPRRVGGTYGSGEEAMPLHRMDRTAVTGCIAWPVHLDSYGACGTSVYAVWPEQRPDEPMVVCCAGLSVRAVLVEEPCGPRE